MPRMHVNAAAINIRSTPEIKPENIVATLPFAHAIETNGTPNENRWIKVKAKFNGKTYRGYINIGYLRAPLSPAKEALLAAASTAWQNQDKSFTLPDAAKGYAPEPTTSAKPAIGDLIQHTTTDLVVAKGLTQVWALTPTLEITKHPLLESGHLDDKPGVVSAVLRVSAMRRP
jgi:hypothetical protein